MSQVGLQCQPPGVQSLPLSTALITGTNTQPSRHSECARDTAVAGPQNHLLQVVDKQADWNTPQPEANISEALAPTNDLMVGNKGGRRIYSCLLGT